LEQIGQLIAGGVATQARLDPILPGLTDVPDGLHALCAALAGAGVKDVAASILFLRPAIVRALRNHPTRPGLFRRLVESYASGKWMQIHAGQGSVLALPAARRRRIFDWLTTIAGQYGINVHVCACKNPDLGGPGCHFAGGWSPPVIFERQMDLFTLPVEVS
jgi:DNA repair photolyase